MALLWVDGFDHYRTSGDFSSADFAGIYAAGAGIARVSSTTVFGSYACQTDSTGNTVMLGKAIPAADTVGVGFHWQNIAHTSGTAGIVRFRNGTTDIATLALSNGVITLRTGGTGGSVVGTATLAPSPATFYHLEFKIVRHASTGILELYVNGSLDTQVTGLALGSSSVDMIHFGFIPTSNQPQMIYDNLFIWDDSGSVNNDVMGEHNVETLFPSGDTSQADWTGNATNLDDVPYSDATLVTSSTVGDRSEFDLGNLASTDVTIAGIMALVRASKDDANPTIVDFGLRASSTDSLGQVSPSQASFAWEPHIMEVNPATTAAWLAGAVNSALVVLERDT
jgi:hypothetical protein